MKYKYINNAFSSNCQHFYYIADIFYFLYKICRAKLVYMASHVSRHFHSCTKFHWVPPLRGSCVLTASHAAAFVCAVRADAVFRLVLQTLHAGKCHLVCTHCSGPDFLAYLASAEDRRWSTISSREIHLTSYITPCDNSHEPVHNARRSAHGRVFRSKKFMLLLQK